MLLYKTGGCVLQKLEQHEGSLKNLVFSSNYRNPKQLYALVCETLKYTDVLEEILEATKFLNNVNGINKPTAKLLLYDFLFGKGIQCSGRFKHIIYSRKSMLQSALARIKIKRKAVKNHDLIASQKILSLPKYLRVNTIKTNLVDVVSNLHDCGYKKVENESVCLQKDEFCVDKFIPNLLNFHGELDFHDNLLYLNGQIIFQDRASCIPAQALSPSCNDTVIDACAAPGNKTSHLASIMQNTGKIFAFDLDPKRLKTMKKLLNKAGVANCDVMLKDFLKVSTTDAQYANVTHILVDPSCSGSGIVSRMSHLTDNVKSNSKTRLEKLSHFQLAVLNHALSFPNVFRVVYSTCSIHGLENENVVKQALDKNLNFSLISCLPTWHRRGCVDFGLTENDAEKCVRCDPNHDSTNGFFVALFERNHEKLRTINRSRKQVSRKKKIKYNHKK